MMYQMYPGQYMRAPPLPPTQSQLDMAMGFGNARVENSTEQARNGADDASETATGERSRSESSGRKDPEDNKRSNGTQVDEEDEDDVQVVV